MITLHLTKTDNLPEDYSLKQGITFDWLTITVPGEDLSDCTPLGQIRKNYAEFDSNVLVSFSFDALTYEIFTLENNTTEYRTVIKPTLTDEETAILPSTKNRKNKSELAIAGKNVWVYDIKLLKPSGETIALTEGYVEVRPDVSRDS